MSSEEGDEAPRPVGGSEVILLAEDDESVRRLTVEILESAGYTVLAAGNGEEAIKLFDAYSGNVDLALLDGATGFVLHGAVPDDRSG